MEISFNAASRFLQRLAVPDFPQVHDRLVALVRTGSIVEAFRTCFPEKWPPVGSLGLHDLDGDNLLTLQHAAIAAVAALFPVQEDYMDMLVDDDEPLQLHPDSCGFAWDDEWLTQVFEDPSEVPSDSSLAMFFKLLWIIATQFGEEAGRQVWDKMQTHFGWPCDLPRIGENVRARDFQWEALYAMLDAEGLGAFKRAIDVALCDTDNLFLDTSPDDYGYGVMQIPDFIAENILELKKIWAEAEAWLADYEACRALVEADPTIYSRLACIWEQVCKLEAHPQPPKTLVEVFTGDDDEPHPTFP